VLPTVVAVNVDVTQVAISELALLPPVLVLVAPPRPPPPVT
jgi:hypothetical protein